MVPESPEADTPLYSCIFNLKTKEVKRIRPPHSVHKHGGHVGILILSHILVIALRHQALPLKDEWEELEPFPEDAITDSQYTGSIDATAVWVDDGGTILFNVFSEDMWAYNVGKNKWYPVKCPEDWDSIKERPLFLETPSMACQKCIF